MGSYIQLSAVLFGVIALGHLLRLLRGSPVTFEGYAVPLWLSWIGFLLAGSLCLWGFRLRRSISKVGSSA